MTVTNDTFTQEEATAAVVVVPPPQPFRLEIRVWVCPDQACGNYHGQSASHDVDLTTATNVESDMRHTVNTKPGNTEVVGNRGECPACRSRGIRRQRVPMAFVVTVDPGKEPVAPEWALKGALELDRPRS